MNSKEFRKVFKKEIDFAICYLKLNINKKSQIKMRNLSSCSGAWNHLTNQIVINPSCESIAEVLFHELTHFKQNQKGLLKIEDGSVYFKNKLQFSDGRTFEEYFNSKHERQARMISKRMLRLFNEIRY